MANPLSLGQETLTAPQFFLRSLADDVLPLQISVQAGIFERDRRLRGQHLQHRQPFGREHAGCQAVLQIEHAHELALLHQRQAEH